MSAFMEILRSAFNDVHISASEVQLRQFCTYRDLLLEWNARQNLTAIRGDVEIARLLFADSAILCPYIPANAACLDVGSGAGFPGLPLAIMRADISMHLLDSQQKRVNFLKHAVETLNLGHCAVLHGRAETLAHEKAYRDQFHCVMARAVAPLNILLEYTLPFARLHGHVLCPKGPNVKVEIRQAQNALRILNGSVCALHPSPTPDRDFIIVDIEKLGATPEEYPRKAGMPEKKPLVFFSEKIINQKSR